MAQDDTDNTALSSHQPYSMPCCCLFFFYPQREKKKKGSLMKLFSLMFEQQKQEPTSSVLKSYRGRECFLTEQFQPFEPIATHSRSLPTLQFSHLATVKLLKRYLSTRLLCY